MSLALARKYRPKRFADVAVQSHVATTLRNAIASDRIARNGELLPIPKADKPGEPKAKNFYFVRDAKWKLRETGDLYDVSHSPYSEVLVKPENDTPESKAARERLGAVLCQLHG